DHMLVEGVGGEIRFGRLQLHLVSCDEPQQVSLARTMRTIAFEDLAGLVVDVEADPPAMAATLIVHLILPLAGTRISTLRWLRVEMGARRRACRQPRCRAPGSSGYAMGGP